MRLLPFDTTRMIGGERSWEKSYEVGIQQEIHVGEPLVRVRDYWLNRYQTTLMRANTDFELLGFTGVRDETFEIVAIYSHFGKEYLVVMIPKGNDRLGYRGILVAEDGTIRTDIILRQNLTKHPKADVEYEPDSLKFEPIYEDRVDKSRGFTNFELVYTGIDENTITALYREYSPDDLARPAFYQNLTYEKDARFIRFRDIRIEVVNADNEGMTFVVVSDGTE